MSLLVVRIRGTLRLLFSVKETMVCLGLSRLHSCKLLPDTPAVRGMLAKAEPYIAWGEADAATEELLTKKNVQRLQPPRGGYERKGVKMPFSKGGAYGYRGKEINALVKRMLP